MAALKLKPEPATTRVRYEVEYPILAKSEEQALRGPYSETKSFDSFDKAAQLHDKLMQSDDSFLIATRSSVVLRQVKTTVLREGGMVYGPAKPA